MRHFSSKVVLVVAVMASAVLSLAAQAPAQKPQFDVASVKPNKSDGPLKLEPNGGRFVAANATLRVLLRFAYHTANGADLLNDQIIGGPAWINTDHFDIEAHAEKDSHPTAAQMWLMVQSLLEDRFQLKVHWEKRELPVYNLVVVKSGTLKLSEDQTPISPQEQVRFSDLLQGSPRGRFSVTAKPMKSGVTLMLAGNAVRIDALTNVLQQYTGRPIVNKTGLNGLYDVRLSFSVEFASAPAGSTQGTALVASDPVASSSMFTAIEEELGVKLQSGRGPVEVLVIDSVQKPSEN